jgi:hypothetical protein
MGITDALSLVMVKRSESSRGLGEAFRGALVVGMRLRTPGVLGLSNQDAMNTLSNQKSTVPG